MSTSPTGTIALIGAGEYLPATATVDQQLLERVSGTPQVGYIAHGGSTRWSQYYRALDADGH